MRDRWIELWQKLYAHTIPQDVFDELIRAYSLPGRFYHNLTHIQDCLSLFDGTRFLACHPEEVELAIWFHDAVYDTRKNNNEQRSAEWAGSVIRQAGLSSDTSERISYSILATRHETEVTDTDAQLLADMDLSILGREEDVFWIYEENIRREYAWVPESQFRQRRMEILRGFLERRHIYYHEKYREMATERARLNLKQAIARLMDAVSDA